jgi:serine/threonine protein kinase
MYFAPEVIEHHYTEKADLWSLGVCIYMILTGEIPFVCEESPVRPLSDQHYAV